ncbi:MAG: hypothetical protein AABZ60_08645 [Planctomycetota bacterium]
MTKQNRVKQFVPSLLLIGFTALMFVFQIYLPNRKINDVTWQEKATVEELRELSHKVLSFPIGNHHDAFMILERVGNKDSIPYLISGLKWQNETNEGIITCEKSCCLKALKKLTGEDVGLSYENWKKWWDSQRNRKKE